MGHVFFSFYDQNSSGFASGGFHQAQLQGLICLFDGQNYPGFASGGFHQAQYQNILGYSECFDGQKLPRFA